MIYIPRRGVRRVYRGRVGVVSPPSGDHPNEPEGFVTVWPQNPLTSLPPTTQDEYGFQRYDLNGQRLEVLSPAGLRLNYPQGIAANSDYHTPFNAQRFLSGESLESPKRRIYFDIRFRTSANWTDNGNSGTKLGFFGLFNEGGQQNSHYLNLTEAGNIRPGVMIERTTWSHGSQTSENYLATGSWAHGETHRLEVLCIGNTIVPGVSRNEDGEAYIWMNGVLVMSATGLVFFHQDQTPCWRAMYINPTYGGGANTPPENLYWDLLSYYCSVGA